MNDMENLTDDTVAEPDVAAAELVLGLLEGEDRASALRRVLAEPGFARQVESWRTHFSQLYRAWPEAEVPEGLRARIERSLDAPEPMRDTAVPARRASRFWPAVAVVSSLIAASLLLVVVLRPIAPVPQEVAITQSVPPSRATPAAVLVAAIDPVAKGDPVTAIYEPATGALRLTEAAFATAGHSAELWVIPADGVPRSLGLMHDGTVTQLSVDASNRALFAAGAVLAVTIEQPGGSPDGSPKGPVVAKGALATV